MSGIEILDGAIAFTNHEGERRTIEADRIFVPGPTRPDTDLAETLASQNIQLERIGDCSGTESIADAFRTAAEAVRRMGVA